MCTMVKMHPIYFNESYSPSRVVTASKLIQMLKVNELIRKEIK